MKIGLNEILLGAQLYRNYKMEGSFLGRLFLFLFYSFVAFLGLFVIALIFGAGYWVISKVKMFFHFMYDFTIVKVIFYPATFDVVHGIFVEHPFLRAIILFVITLALLGISSKLGWVKSEIILVSIMLLLTICALVTLVRAGYYAGVGINMKVVGEENYSSKEHIVRKMDIDIITQETLPYEPIHYNFVNSEEDPKITDLNGKSYLNTFWVYLGKEIDSSEKVPTLDFSLEPDAFWFSKVEEMDYFEGVLSLADRPDATNPNSSMITLNFVGDGKILDTYTVNSGSEPINVKVDIKEIKEEFIIAFQSDNNGDTVVALFEPRFTKEK
ncbi:hypothetical protein V7147_21015 [Bacillus sp. JJ1521]|uniref:hypothetical protein n=1 Tax=Bacillus sp. JJ1521 TaxID=3122957 RepID=UPI002FFE637D